MLPRFHFLVLFVGILSVLLASCTTENPVSRGGFAVTKVNRTLLDKNGYETDQVGDLKAEAIYQYALRTEPKNQFGARFHIKWKAPKRATKIRLVLDVQGLRPDNESTRATITRDLPDMDGWAEWTTLDIAGTQFKQLGEIMAWRVTILSQDRVMAELPSGNWYSDLRSQTQVK